VGGRTTPSRTPLLAFVAEVDEPTQTTDPQPFSAPSPDERARWLELVGDRRAHDQIVEGLRCMQQTDVEMLSGPAQASGWLRVAAWNIERGRDPARAATLIDASGARVTLLTEVDVGMGRTGNRDVARELARALRATSVFGIEFIELALGKAADLATLQDADNRCGLHGNAILARVPLRDPAVIRLDDGGEWFTTERGEPRIGGRMAVVATLELDGVDVQVASVHLESHSNADERAAQMAVLFDAIDASGRGPAIIGGDLNTFGAPIGELATPASLRRLRADEPGRFSWPVAHEPLFEIAATHGYEWVDANVAAPTTRHGADGLPDHHPLKLDWLLVRGLEARRATVVPAIAEDGSPLSDHELIVVSVRLSSRAATGS
jgi:endonuclease/exonuclease/phosphatase family metal-dependent hydrolase